MELIQAAGHDLKPRLIQHRIAVEFTDFEVNVDVVSVRSLSRRFITEDQRLHVDPIADSGHFLRQLVLESDIVALIVRRVDVRDVLSEDSLPNRGSVHKLLKAADLSGYEIHAGYIDQVI